MCSESDLPPHSVGLFDYENNSLLTCLHHAYASGGGQAKRSAFPGRRYGMDSGVYGSKYYETPHMDKLAKQSMLFTDQRLRPPALLAVAGLHSQWTVSVKAWHHRCH